MGVKEKDIVCHMAGQAQTLPWLSTYVSALVCQAANDHKAGQQMFQVLVQVTFFTLHDSHTHAHGDLFPIKRSTFQPVFGFWQGLIAIAYLCVRFSVSATISTHRHTRNKISSRACQCQNCIETNNNIDTNKNTHIQPCTQQNFPESVEALGGLAVCQMEIGNNDEAVQAFSQVQAGFR